MSQLIIVNKAPIWHVYKTKFFPYDVTNVILETTKVHINWASK